MSRSPKPIATKRKRAAALNASDPSARLNGTTAPLNGTLSHSGTGIAELAQDLADLQKLSIMLANAEGPAERAREAQAAKDIQDEAHTACCRAERDIENVGHRSNA